MKKLSIFALLILLFAGCQGPQDLPVTGPHYNRAPTVWGIQAESDTLASGKRRILLTWNVTDTSTLKGFEVFRSLNTLTVPKSIAQLKDYRCVDSFAVAATDTFVYYYISTIGKDLFIGKNSDTILVNIKK